MSLERLLASEWPEQVEHGGTLHELSILVFRAFRVFRPQGGKTLI